MIEEGYTVQGMEFEDPVKAIREVSRDPTLKRKIKLDDGRQMTAVEVQRVYLDRAQEYLAQQEHDPILDDIWQRWAMVLDKLEEDPMQLVREIDWVTKRHLIQSYIDKKGCGWDDPRVFLLDLQFHDVKRTRGLYYLMESRGLIERVVEEERCNGPCRRRRRPRGRRCAVTLSGLLGRKIDPIRSIGPI